jgi:hypothetical protein
MERIDIIRKETLEGRLFGKIFPAHATRDGESVFYGLTLEEAGRLKELIPVGNITGDTPATISRQFKFPSALSSGMIIDDYGNRAVLWVEYDDKRISIFIKLR